MEKDNEGITTKGGLLFRNGKMIPLPEADAVSIQHGHLCAEIFVKALETEQLIKSNPNKE